MRNSAGQYERRPTSERFEERVERVPFSGCWLWTGQVFDNGYGQFRAEIDGCWRTLRAHRFSYQMFVGPIGRQCVLHRCDVPLCVNPAHLFLGTNADNTADMLAKGRYPVGERSSRRKWLNDEQVGQIKARLATNARRGACAALAREYRVPLHVIIFIKNGRAWRNVAAAGGVPLATS